MTRTNSLGMSGHQSAKAKNEEWLTPPDVLAALGLFDLDPCAPVTRPWPMAAQHFTITDDGLARPWFGRVWLNPPYTSNVIGRWLARLAAHNRGTALIFARTETEAFCRHVWSRASGLLFLAGRLHFHYVDGRRAAFNAGAPSVLCAYGPDDMDILSACSLPGAFVPLRLPRGVLVVALDGTWRDTVADWMRRQPGPVALGDIYRAFARHRKAQGNPNYRAKLRQVLQQGPFRRVDRGMWEAA